METTDSSKVGKLYARVVINPKKEERQQRIRKLNDRLEKLRRNK